MEIYLEFVHELNYVIKMSTWLNHGGKSTINRKRINYTESIKWDPDIEIRELEQRHAKK